MTPESIVTSLEWSKKLQEAGWPQDSLFTWFLSGSAGLKQKWLLLTRDQFHDGLKNERAAAPTAEEILRRLPHWVQGLGHIHIDVINDNGTGDYSCAICYRAQGTLAIDYLKQTSIANSLANAAAAMFCFLKENNLLP